MNFEFSAEQSMLREQAQGVLQQHCSPSQVREVFENDQGIDARLWRQLSDLGWTATIIPEEFGGLGLSYLELCVIAEELGRALAPIPFSSSVYLTTEAILMAGSEEQKKTWLPGLADGSVIGCMAVAEAKGHNTASLLTTRFENGVLNGRKIPVADAESAQLAVVFAASSSGDGATAYLVNLEGTERIRQSAFDPTRPQASVELNSAAAEQLGSDGEGWRLLQSIYDRAAVLFAWEQIGGAEASLEMAKNYAMERYAFGRPIASFQAIKHKLAQMYVKNTLARSNAYYGSWALSSNAPELGIAAAAARVSGIQAYYFASKENIQTHGGMGYTWELDCHLHYKRSKVLATCIGAELIWQEKLMAAIDADRAA